MNTVKTMTYEEMAHVNAGAGGINIPSRPIVNIISYIACGGHNWIQTGREYERPYFIFWTKHQHEYVCTKCGRKTWIDD